MMLPARQRNPGNPDAERGASGSRWGFGTAGPHV